ncbi:MAG: sulfotransferase [Pseudomonadota bacterium]
MRDRAKAWAGQAVAAVNPQCRFDRAVFVLAHMRCGSTALSNVLCSRPDISGYGEAHVRYLGPQSLGQLVVNQALRRGWKPGARHLFDKLLHNRHDEAAPPAFFTARAILVAREPVAAIRSVRALYAGPGRVLYQTDAEVAAYYIARVEALLAMWPRFAAGRRVALTHAELLTTPDAALARISDRLGFGVPLENRYVSPVASRKSGGGDPVVSGRHTRIVARADRPDSGAALEVDPAVLAAAQDAYARFAGIAADA